MSTLEHEIEFPKLDYDVIIAMKGLPCMGKSEIANAIGTWAGSPVLYIDDFLFTLSKQKGYTYESPPPNEEAVRGLLDVAFDGLYEAASHLQRRHKRCVVIKSRLDSKYELNHLAQLGLEGSFRMILIIECWTKNEYRWESRFKKKLEEQRHRYWYKPNNWMEIRKYRDDFLDRAKPDFLDHFRNFREGNYAGNTVIRIELDPFNDLTLDPTTKHTFLLTSSFLHAINRLLSRDELHVRRHQILAQPDTLEWEKPVQFQELRLLLLRREVGSWNEGHRSKYLCGKGVKRCAFNYYFSFKAFITRAGSTRAIHDHKCAACEKPFALGESAYTCCFCPLPLHKSCAELRGFQSRGFEKLDLVKNHPYWAHSQHLPSRNRQACDSCKQERKSFSDKCYSCLYQNYLKQQVFPTIVDHDSHSGPLSIKFEENSSCKACNGLIPLCSYGCYGCSLSYHMECLLLPQTLEHEHGGYRHVMEIKYSRDGMEEEGYWCDVCYKDMDPQTWFYSCKECHYEAHPDCTNFFNKYEEEVASKLRETAGSSTS